MPTPHSLIEEGVALFRSTLANSIWCDERKRTRITNLGLVERSLLQTYTAGVAGHFQVLLGTISPFVASNEARAAVTDNILCEMKHDHYGMLMRFALDSHAMPTTADHLYVEPSRKGLFDHVFSENEHIGLRGVAALATLESVSAIFIPTLAALAKSQGCTNFTYTNVHGEADAAHSDAFVKGLHGEANIMLGRNWEEVSVWGMCRETVTLTTDYLLHLFSDSRYLPQCPSCGNANSVRHHGNMLRCSNCNIEL